MVRITQSTLDMLNAGTPQIKKNKYKNKKIVIDGYKFDSIKEGNRYRELKLQKHAGLISKLKLQVGYVLIDGFKYKDETIRKITYFCDFEYLKDGVVYTEDVKGFKTPVYKLKRKLLLSRYPDINFIET